MSMCFLMCVFAVCVCLSDWINALKPNNNYLTFQDTCGCPTQFAKRVREKERDACIFVCVFMFGCFCACACMGGYVCVYFVLLELNDSLYDFYVPLDIGSGS